MPAGGFPQHWNAVSPSSCCPRGFFHPRHWVGASPLLQLCPSCHQLPPKCCFNQQQQPGPCQAPGWELCPSGRRDGTRAGGLQDMGQLCHPRERGMRIKGQGPSFPSSTPEPSWIFASLPEPLQLKINISSAQLLSRVCLQPWGGQGTVPVSLCSSRGTARLDSRASGTLGRVLSVPTSAHHVPFQETFILYPQL